MVVVAIRAPAFHLPVDEIKRGLRDMALAHPWENGTSTSALISKVVSSRVTSWRWSFVDRDAA